MKKKMVLLLGILSAGTMLSALDPVLNYDYTSGAFERTGKAAAPIITGETLMTEEAPGAIRFDGKKNFMLVPDAKSFPLKKGATFFAYVRFDESKDYGMLFFKFGEFLLGLYKAKYLYFNTTATPSTGKTFDSALYCLIPRGKWITVTAVLRPNPTTWTVFLYVDGERKTSRTFKFEKGFLEETKNDLTIGKGWGGVWFLKGDIGTVKIYDAPMSDKQVMELSKKYLDKK